MPRRIIAAIAAFTISIASIACSGGETTPETGAGTAPPAQAQAQAQPENAPQGPGPVRVTRPTRPPRLDLSRTGTPAETRQTRETQSAQPTAQAAEKAQDTPAQTQPPAAQTEGTPAGAPERPGSPRSPEGLAPGDLIPEDPETNDEVLLQDIYALMDLDRFALDPGTPIPIPGLAEKKLSTTHRVNLFVENFFDDQAEPRRSKYPDSIFELAEVEGHPYLHLFPGLRWTAEKAGPFLRNSDLGRTFIYNPFGATANKYLRSQRSTRHFRPRDGNTHFIYHPWFEPLEEEEIDEGTKLYGSRHRMDEYGGVPGKKDGWDVWIYTHSPHWFGKNSTRGVLSEAVAEALSQAIKPGAEDHDLLVRIHHTRNSGRGRTEYGTGWSLAEYLRTPIIAEKGRIGAKENKYSHQMPTTQWEFLHPGLPIVRVTNFLRAQMPFRVPGEDLGHSDIAVSFVVSFQNRWASFDDPNRWLFRFEEEMREIQSIYKQGPLPGPLGGIDPEMHERLFPRYWHSSDYMQHRIIGPVVVQVYEPVLTSTGQRGKEKTLRESPLQPGVYHAYPKVSEWEAPGPILQDEQLRVTVIRPGTHETMEILRPKPAAQSPNPGWPLPGHVMTHPGTGPGTEVWEDFKLDGHEW